MSFGHVCSLTHMFGRFGRLFDQMPQWDDSTKNQVKLATSNKHLWFLLKPSYDEKQIQAWLRARAIGDTAGNLSAGSEVAGEKPAGPAGGIDALLTACAASEHEAASSLPAQSRSAAADEDGSREPAAKRMRKGAAPVRVKVVDSGSARKSASPPGCLPVSQRAHARPHTDGRVAYTHVFVCLEQSYLCVFNNPRCPGFQETE